MSGSRSARLWLAAAGVVVLLGGCKPSADPRYNAQSKDRRTTFAGVSILVPAGVAWWKAPRGHRMSATWGETQDPWCDVDDFPGAVGTPTELRVAAEREWKSYLPDLQSWHPGAKIPKPNWTQLGPNPYYAARFKTNEGPEQQSGFVIVGDRLIMVTMEFPESGIPVDPKALPTLRQLAESLRPVEKSGGLF